MPTYTATQPYSEYGVSITAGVIVTTPTILTECKAPVADPGAYVIGETVNIDTAAATAIVWGNTYTLRLILVTGTIPTIATTIEGVTSSQTQSAVIERCVTRTADTPIDSAVIDREDITSTGVSDPKTYAVPYETNRLLITNITGAPLTVSNASAGNVIHVATTAFLMNPNHRIASLVLTFAAAGGCSVVAYKESPLVSLLQGGV